jgi:heptosyltransferase-2
MSEHQPNRENPFAVARAARLVVFAPNWLGDAVMALPALADVRRASPEVTIAVAARPSIAPLFEMADGIQEILTLPVDGPVWRDRSGPLRDGRFDAALLLTNSFHTAYLAWSAGIPERWGYATDWRGRLLTRRVAPPRRLHQASFYQHLVGSLGFPADRPVPTIQAPASSLAKAANLLAAAGWNRRAPLMALAPGAAYGGAKRWPASSYAAAATTLGANGYSMVLIGSRADAPAGRECIERIGRSVAIFNLIGGTDLTTLAGVLSLCRGLISNDSGAMHLAAALGVPVTAMFGPTDETATRPLGQASTVVLTHPVWCRPCMLRECPLDHRCMVGISVDSVVTAARRAS